MKNVEMMVVDKKLKKNAQPEKKKNGLNDIIGMVVRKKPKKKEGSVKKKNVEIVMSKS